MKKQETSGKLSQKWLLPLIAGIMAVFALFIVLFIPKGMDEGSGRTSAEEDKASSSPQMENTATEINVEGNMVIFADRLSSDQVSFIRISQDSRIELLARLGDDGTVKAALGTCQSCFGSPAAYYTQEGDKLKCNNCGLTFLVSVLDSPGGGCHPVMLKEGITRYEGNDLAIDLNALSVYEGLFTRIADH